MGNFEEQQLAASNLTAGKTAIGKWQQFAISNWPRAKAKTLMLG
jgi:hypothetical protein